MTKRPLPEEPESPRAPFSPIRTIFQVEEDTIGKGNNVTSRRLALYGLRREAKKRHMRTTEPEICRRNYRFIKSKLEAEERADALAASQAAQATQAQIQQAAQTHQQAQQTINTQIASLQTEVDRLKAEKQTWFSQRLNEVGEKTRLTKEKDTLAASMAVLQRDFDEGQSQFQSLERERDTLKDELRAMKRNKRDLGYRVEDLEEEKDLLNKLLDDFQGQLARANTGATQAAADLNRALARVGRRDIEIRNLRSRVREWEAWADEWQRDGVEAERVAEEEDAVEENAVEEDDESRVLGASARLQGVLELSGAAAASMAPTAFMGQHAPTARMGQDAPEDQDPELEEDLQDYVDEEEEQPVVDDELGSAAMDESSEDEESESEESEEEEQGRPTSKIGRTGKRLLF